MNHQTPNLNLISKLQSNRIAPELPPRSLHCLWAFARFVQDLGESCSAFSEVLFSRVTWIKPAEIAGPRSLPASQLTTMLCSDSATSSTSVTRFLGNFYSGFQPWEHLKPPQRVIEIHGVIAKCWTSLNYRFLSWSEISRFQLRSIPGAVRS